MLLAVATRSTHFASRWSTKTSSGIFSIFIKRLRKSLSGDRANPSPRNRWDSNLGRLYPGTQHIETLQYLIQNGDQDDLDHINLRLSKIELALELLGISVSDISDADVNQYSIDKVSLCFGVEGLWSERKRIEIASSKG